MTSTTTSSQTVTSTTSTSTTTTTSTSTTSSISTTVTSTRTSTSTTSSTSTSYSSSSTSSTSTAPKSACRNLLGGVAIAGDAEGPEGPRICEIGAWEDDLWHCFAPDTAPAGSCGTAICSVPTNNSGGSTGRCETCATLVMQDWNQMFYIYGELQWAAFGPSEVEEAALQGYQVSLTDHCGHDLLLLHSLPVDPLKAKGDDDSCCDAANWYMLRIGYTAIPQDTVALAISSWEGNFQKLVPLFQESYTTTTTTTFTVTSTTSMTSSITRVSTTSSTSLSSTSSTTQEPILEILEGCLSVSTVSADVFTSNPLEARQAVQQALADATRVELAMVEVTSLSLGGCGAAGGRRLQEELSFDYVIRFPPSSPNAGGAGQSLAEATAQQLAEMPVNEAMVPPALPQFGIAKSGAAHWTLDLAVEDLSLGARLRADWFNFILYGEMLDWKKVQDSLPGQLIGAVVGENRPLAALVCHLSIPLRAMCTKFCSMAFTLSLVASWSS
eukprot:s122_g7.t1